MPYRNFQRGCVSCVVLLLFAVLVLLILSCLFGLTFSRWFTPTTQGAGVGERQVVQLAPAIPSAPYRANPAGIFYSNRITVSIAPGIVLLSSTPDGTGAMMTDDQATLQIIRADGSTSARTYDFRSGDRPGINPVPAQDVSALFQPGLNIVTITLRDVMPFTYSSLPYYLIFFAPPTPTSTAIASSSATATAPLKTATSTSTRVTPNRASVASVTPTMIASPTMIAPTPVPLVRATDSGGAPNWVMPMAIAGGILFAGIVPLMLMITRRAPDAATDQSFPGFGWLNLYDSQTHEAHPPIDLAQFPQGLVIYLNPLRVESPGDDAQCIAAVRPSPEGMILVANNVPVINAMSWEKDLETGIFSSSPGHLLRDGMQLVIDARLELEYRNPRENFTAAGELESWEGIA